MEVIETKTITMKDAHAEISQYRNINYKSFSVLISDLAQRRIIHKAGKGLISLDHWNKYVSDIAERQKIGRAQWVPP